MNHINNIITYRVVKISVQSLGHLWKSFLSAILTPILPVISSAGLLQDIDQFSEGLLMGFTQFLQE